MNRLSKVLVTRPRGQAKELESLLLAEGMDVLFQPVIEIGPPDDSWSALDSALQRLNQFDWVVFSSSNGVDAFKNRLLELHFQPPSSLKFAAIGPGTAAALEKYGFLAHFIPNVYRAENLAEGLLEETAPGSSFLLIRASRGREILSEILTCSGRAVVQAVAYSSRDVTFESPLWNPEARSLLENGSVDWVTITSSAIAGSAVRLFGDSLKKARLASISSLTSGALEKLGFPPAAEAEEATIPGLVRAIVSHRHPQA